MTQFSLPLKAWLQAHIVALMTALILLQPVLDVLSFWQDQMGMGNALTLALRFALLAAVAAAGFLLAQRKRPYLILGAVLFLFAACHVAAVLQVDALTVPADGEVTGWRALCSDLANLARVAQIPIFTLCFITFFKQSGERGFRAVQKALLAVLLMIAAVEVVSVLTGTNPYTYANKEIGILGWFATTNAQSAVLTMIVPITIMSAIRRDTKRIEPQLAICVLGFAMLFFFGTRLAYLGIFATAIGLAFTIIVADRQKKRSIAVLLVCTALCAAAFPLSPMFENQQRVAENAVLKQQEIDRQLALGEEKAERLELSGEAYELTRLDGAYRLYLEPMVDKYGIARVAERYGYSTEVGDLADARRAKKTFCTMMMEDAPLLSTLFGLELGDMTYHEENYDLENDFHGIFMLYGAVGLVLLAGFFLYFLGLILWALLKNAKKYYTLEAGGFGIALLMALLHAYATAGVLRRPNASVYLSIILAAIYFLVLIRHSAGGAKPAALQKKKEGAADDSGSKS